MAWSCLDKLLSEGTDPDWVNPATGLTPLLTASMYGRAECVLSLLRAGADIYAVDSQGRTSLERLTKMLKNMCARVNQWSQLILILIWLVAFL